MADSIDPIMDTPSAKRQKLANGDVHQRAKKWDSDNDSGDNLEEEDFASATIPTLPLTGQKRSHVQYGANQLHADLKRVSPSRTPQWSTNHAMQATQASHATQPTQPLNKAPEVLVDRSSPVAPTTSSSSQPKPQPTTSATKAPFSRPNGLLASAMAPAGTTFRRPGLAQRRVPDSDSEDDPPLNRSSDEETQTMRSDLKPTTFTKGGRGLNSSPNRINESPRAPGLPSTVTKTAFTDLLSGLSYQPPRPSSSGQSRPADDMASAYSGRPRPPKQAQPPRPSAPSSAPLDASMERVYRSLDDLHDFALRSKVTQMRLILPNASISECVKSLRLKNHNVQDAMDWLAQEEDAAKQKDELTLSPVQRKGVAKAVNPQSSSQSHASQLHASQPMRPSAKQQIKAPVRSIAEKYSRREPAPNAVVISDEDEDDEDVKKPKRRLVRKGAPREATPPSSPPPKVSSRAQEKVISIESDLESEIEADTGDDDEIEAVTEVSTQAHDEKLLTFFNECSVRDLAELCAQPEDTIQKVFDQRPFRDLDHVRTITITGTTKSGKQSRARPIGDKLVDDCSEMLTGYNAVDELVKQCEKLSEPIQKALKSWGVKDSTDGELQIMNLEDSHDSGIGTPSSTFNSEEGPASKTKPKKAKRDFIGQPANMSPDITLKDYQLVGLNWLNLLFKQETSCILADDMGLGKTCQVISFLSYLQTQEVDGVHLIIVPGSTLENWLREFERFSPDLQVRPYYGSQAERFHVRETLHAEFNEIDVIVTTYDMAVGPEDNKFLRKLGPFSVCVYDEAHALRNPESKRYQQLVRIGADFKVLLTGTPLQNNLQELIAILAFIMPDMFQEKREDLEYIFKHKASTKNTDSAALFSSERIGRARTMMTPFILRRKKHQVLDLPTKHCRVEYCDMTESQTDCYADVLDEAQTFYKQKTVAGKSNAKVNARASANVIMSLRKAAIHPLLSRRIYSDKRIDKMVSALKKTDEFCENPIDKIRAYLTGEAPISLKGGDYGLHKFCAERPEMHKFMLKKQEWMDAGKVAKLKELIVKYHTNGDRCLIFSQFTTAMDILEQVLETLGIKFLRLDGGTRMDIRQDMIDTFYADTEITVFMLSTRAGGAGINLAAANKVIIFDSGFNPQDDVQAENRAHRVGQTREVEVVRLVTRSTIEENIHALGESKLALDERVAGDAGAADEKAMEKAGEQIVEKMFVEGLKAKGDSVEGTKPRAKKVEDPSVGDDLTDAFKKGLEGQGVKVKSKQATL